MIKRLRASLCFEVEIFFAQTFACPVMSQAGFPLSPAALLTLAADPVGSRSVLGEGLVGQSWARVRTLGVVFS